MCLFSCIVQNFSLFTYNFNRTMANHKSAKKRIRQTEKRRVHNRYFAKTARNAVKALRNTTEKEAALALLPKVTAMLDKLAKKNIIHDNKAANLKSSLQLHVNAIA
ncbi:SSU ribosomal protein S20p [Mucinivorans hirudinis]|uniref:Small ribosomal subunit protein bS20 n=1 Tax=Mucinivorans hirudinis TaxID=1433126 RepID=A0A060RBF9_9BACT|nr:SSU ribosomal protein S20p [Mucinivorans hirudinis]